ncbi:MAG TPA: cobyrinate a,c-diamide synthase [Solirubrobacteraceae bacterium]|nr:cobyrinate a,c-diamide synthase [Solirubrobacteraceae bacterium]
MIPRVVIAGTSSGAGKTTVACGLIGALRRAGRRVQGFKVGPDYIDPSYHSLASGRPGRNLDAFLSGPDLIAPLIRHGAAGADIAVIEGVMGLFDGVSGRGELASTAHVARLLRAPVILVVDGSAMARSAAAVIHGFRTFDPEVSVAGVIFNRVGSDSHEALLREAVSDLPAPRLAVLGALRRDDRLTTPERHLGLVPAGEREPRAAAALDVLAESVARLVDLAEVERLARSAPELRGPAWSPEPAGGRPTNQVRVAIARGPAFSFHYEENLELLTAAGAELAPVDPIADEALPENSRALILAGGFPEVFGAELAANRPLRAQIAAFAAAGRPVLAECGGLLYLARELDGHDMCSVLPAYARMAERLTLGYREAVAATGTPWLQPGEAVRGHEFHYSAIEYAGGDAPPPAWELTARGRSRSEGCAAGSVQASYLHVHWAAHPHLAARFVAAAA